MSEIKAPAKGEAPVIVLVAPQLGENIGAAARVMGNFGLTELRLVSPRDGWPNPVADTMSAGAIAGGHVQVSVWDRLEDALGDLSLVLATTARPRDMVKPILGLSEAIHALKAHDGRTGVLFGAEKSGLSNEAVTLADAILTYSVNAAFASLNLGQAVGVLASLWGMAEALSHTVPGDNAAQIHGFDAGKAEVQERSGAGLTPVGRGFTPVGEVSADRTPATKAELIGMCEHFEAELDRAGFFHPEGKRAVMVQNLRNAFTRAGWTAQEVRTFRGAVKALALGRGSARVSREEG